MDQFSSRIAVLNIETGLETNARTHMRCFEI
jgi:hypothetical protein